MPLEKYLAVFMHRVTMILKSLLKNGSEVFPTFSSSDSERRLEEEISRETLKRRIDLASASNLLWLGGGCLLRRANAGKNFVICSATAIFAKSINSSTKEFASFDSYISRSIGSCVDSSLTKRT